MSCNLKKTNLSTGFFNFIYSFKWFWSIKSILKYWWNVDSWNSNTGILRISNTEGFVIGDVIKGLTSGTQGGNYALAAGKVLMDTDMSAEQVAKKAIEVASEICVFTNNNIKIEKI